MATQHELATQTEQQNLRIPVSELTASLAARETATGGVGSTPDETPNTRESEVVQGAAADTEELPWDSGNEVVVGNWTELGGRIFVDLLSTLLIVTLAWSIWHGDEPKPNIKDPVLGADASPEIEADDADEQSRIATSLAMDPVADQNDSTNVGIPGGLQMKPSRDVNADPYVTTASGQMPADPSDDLGQIDTFTIRTLRPSAEGPNFPGSNANTPNARVGQPTEQFNDSIYR